jgi:ketosteroid isomerase-like protein
MIANETVIRDAYAAYARGEIDNMLDLVDAALHRQAENGLTSRIEEVRASGDQVLVVSHTPGVDAYRVTPANDRNYDVFTVRQGRVVAIRAYGGRADALAAIGIA